MRVRVGVCERVLVHARFDEMHLGEFVFTPVARGLTCMFLRLFFRFYQLPRFASSPCATDEPWRRYMSARALPGAGTERGRGGKGNLEAVWWGCGVAHIRF